MESFRDPDFMQNESFNVSPHRTTNKEYHSAPTNNTYYVPIMNYVTCLGTFYFSYQENVVCYLKFEVMVWLV